MRTKKILGHSDTIKSEFAKQASRFGGQGLTLSSQEYLAWMVDILPLQAGFRVLDVATGTGHLSRAAASYVTVSSSSFKRGQWLLEQKVLKI
jgi:protein-L-isoaspartate O-methyltransferase